MLMNEKLLAARSAGTVVGLLLLLCNASGQDVRNEDPFSIHRLGESGIEFHDKEAKPGQSYRVEWSSDLKLWWRSWEPLDDIRSRGADLATTVGLPQYFRVTRVDSSFSSVRALQDEDFLTDAEAEAIKVTLGRHLFYDKILSGNRNISCATCHHSLTGTGDGLSLPVGEGGHGLGVTRDLGENDTFVHERVPRNAPAVFNLGMTQITTMFADGRLTTDADQPSGFASPAGDQLPMGLDSVLAAQAMFPVTSNTEMAGQPGENEVADAAVAGDFPRTWEILAQRLRVIPSYFVGFRAAFPDEIRAPADITFVHVANAIAAFEGVAWRTDNSPFDRFLRGEHGAMSTSARRGMELFYGKAGCADCHSGALQTDEQFYAIAMPQIGPGKGHGPSGSEDYGREAVTGNPADRFKFRTPVLRNVALTGPYGHSGAYRTLRAVVEHHLDPVASLQNYDPSQAQMPRHDAFDDEFVYRTRTKTDKDNLWQAIADANELSSVTLSEKEVDAVIDFLHALTDPVVFDLRQDVPHSVPSLLPIFE